MKTNSRNIASLIAGFVYLRCFLNTDDGRHYQNKERQNE